KSSHFSCTSPRRAAGFPLLSLAEERVTLHASHTSVSTPSRCATGAVIPLLAGSNVFYCNVSETTL
ncbi:MAG: hypothetical protein NZ529_11405, partial [Cytophagaceae bacterium]|nr:hypothetical protein [Cytophagaceae bacterium]MDW8457390.1 hypothetical protein [Cytophagaceae bacterium]